MRIKEKAWRGLREHSLAGWNIGAAPYGYLAERVPHPVPMKASQGRTKTWLILDPGRAPTVAAIFTWRTEDRLGAYAITQRLIADPASYPPPKGGRWTEATVYAILRNPKYTGYMVFGRQRTLKSGRTVAVPPDQWLWSPEPAHPAAIITRSTFDAAQEIGAEHATSRDGTSLSAHRQARRTYILRGRVRCRSYQRRMSGITRTATRYWDDGTDYGYTYYACHHDPANPRHTAKEGHPRSISVREDHLLDVIRQFFAQRIFGPDRAALLAADLPATTADDQARRDRQTAECTKRLRQIDAAENAHAREIEALAHDASSNAVTALRSRILARFTELEDERAQITAQLAELAKTAPQAGDPAMLESLPLLGDLLASAPPRLQQQLYQAFDIQALYNKNMHQVTIHATITDSTPRAVAAITADACSGPAAGTQADGTPRPSFFGFGTSPYVLR